MEPGTRSRLERFFGRAVYSAIVSAVNVLTDPQATMSVPRSLVSNRERMVGAMASIKPATIKIGIKRRRTLNLKQNMKIITSAAIKVPRD